MEIKGKPWKLSPEHFEPAKNLIKSYGAEESPPTNEYEVWRLNVGKSQFILYSSGKLFNNQATSEAVLELREKLTQLVGAQFKSTKREFVIGLDETGKGEVIGHAFLCGATFPSNISKEIEEIIGIANTKSRRTYDYWDSIFAKLDDLQGRGLSFNIQPIPPWHLDKYHTNKLMDMVYKRIITDITRNLSPEQTSIVIDNYQIDDDLKTFLYGLEKKGIVIVVEEKADDSYLESKLASILAKREREKLMREINEKWKIGELPVGSGSVSDSITIAWLKKWRSSGDPWPWFVKRSFSTIRELDGKIGKAKKENPPIKHELVSEQSRKLFEEGLLSTSSLTVSCPKCGSNLNSVKITPDEKNHFVGRCVSCKQVLDSLSMTLLYYNGTVLPDSNAIIGGVLSKDLYKGRFFEDFTILLHPIVRHECDNPGGKAELGKLADIASTQRIRMVTLNETIDEKLSPDDQIVSSAKKNNAILLTKDRGPYATATGLDVFVIT